ncbi:hypothetical protein LJC56_05305 [Christensenellaceae bacterium OttesenSCG-928-K19]|nr:hypothetical protein [Christensenellaceae bacterium OttesenSCG-928-K19]
MKKVMAIILSAMIVVAFLSCARSPVSGTWESVVTAGNLSEENEALLGNEAGTRTCYFQEDGTFSTTIGGKEVQTGSYSFEGDSLYIYGPEQTRSDETDSVFLLEGATLKDSSGNTLLRKA